MNGAQTRGRHDRSLEFSASEAEPSDERAIALDVLTAEVVEQAAALTDEHQQPAPTVMVVLVVAEMLCQMGDALREKGHLDLR
jgi:hypothetical protein